MSPDIVTLIHDKREKYNVDRRLFLLSTPGLLVAGKRLLTGQTPPVPGTPVVSQRPDPIDLGRGITLLDYRIHPGEPLAMIGEIRNDGDTMIDSPTVSITYPTTDGGEGFSWLSPTIPIMEAGESVPVFGPVPGMVNGDNTADGLSFALCTAAEPGAFSAVAETYDFEFEFLDTTYEIDSYSFEARIWNRGEQSISSAVSRGIIRDSSGRIAGVTSHIRHSTIIVDGFRGAGNEAKVDDDTSVRASPFPLLHDNHYNVELRAAPFLWDDVIAQGCEFGRPWQSTDD